MFGFLKLLLLTYIVWSLFMCYLNILNPWSINFKSTKCFLWHQLLALLFIEICGYLLIVCFSSVPTVMVRYDSKNICLFKELFKSHRFFPILWAYPSVVLVGLFLLIAFKNTLTSWQTLKSSPKKEKIQHSQTCQQHKSVTTEVHLTPPQTYFS